MSNENQRDFKGVWIPKAVWLDTRLNALEKVILTEIDSLDIGERGCYASNQYIAEFCQCSETKVSTAISKLINLGYLYVQKFDGRQRELKSRLTKNESLNFKNCNSDFENLQENNTDNNTKNNTVRKKKESKKETKPTGYDAILSEITDDSLRETYIEYIKMRKLIKAPMTDRALRMLIDKANKLEPDSVDRQKRMLETAIMNNWKSVYPLKDDDLRGNAKTKTASRDQSYDLDEFERMTMYDDCPVPTAGTDENIKKRADALKSRLAK